jgi:hypothetical protein
VSTRFHHPCLGGYLSVSSYPLARPATPAAQIVSALQDATDKDSNPFMVHMLLLWFSGWYSFYSYNTVKRESINGSTTCTVALPHVTGL